ncbi:MAG: ASCH domain-containing protein [Candidatus Daviesbacteria bacterium]|nr:ASCH domain-containing protein [Candidatus Daviesbacteria bacterium]
MRKHLAIMDKPTIEAILSGIKTIETRFSLHKIAPFCQIGVGDVIYMKSPGGEIVGQFKVKKVIFFEGLTLSDLGYLSDLYKREISAEKEYWERKKDAKFGTLIFISESERFITSPIKIKKSDQRGWMVLD